MNIILKYFCNKFRFNFFIFDKTNKMIRTQNFIGKILTKNIDPFSGIKKNKYRPLL